MHALIPEQARAVPVAVGSDPLRALWTLTSGVYSVFSWKVEVPTPPEDAVRSPDGRHWWDGRHWIPVTARPPVDALLSPDGSQWWDGKTWQPTDAADADYEGDALAVNRFESVLSLETIRASPGGLIAIAGALALVLGAFLPWISFSAVLVGTVEGSGFDNGDSWAFLFVALTAFICGFGAIRGQVQLGLSIGLLLFGSLGAIGVVYEFSNVGGTIDSANQTANGYGFAAFGIGLYLLIIGAGAVIVGGVFELTRWRSSGRLTDDE
jgi:hypothetical protein